MDALSSIQISGEKLREAREQSGYKLSEAAQLIGVDRQSLYAFETGRAFPAGNTLLRLLALYQIKNPLEISAVKMAA